MQTSLHLAVRALEKYEQMIGWGRKMVVVVLVHEE
jgi:hypothetical protein